MKIEANSDGLLDVRLTLHVTKSNTVRVLINGNVHPLFVGYYTVAKALKRVFDEFPKAVIDGSDYSWLGRIVFDAEQQKVRICHGAMFFTYEELEEMDNRLKGEIELGTFMDEYLNNAELHRADHLYKNTNRYYPRQEVAAALFKTMPRIKTGTLRGEFGKPEDKATPMENGITNRLSRIEEQRISHQINKIWIDNEGVVRGKVVPTGPFGGELVEQIKTGKKPEFRMRAISQLELVDNKLQPQPGSLDIITFDIVDMKD